MNWRIDRAATLAAEFASGSPFAYAATRQALMYSASLSLDETLALEEHFMREPGASENHRAALATFFGKQKAYLHRAS